LDQAIAFGLCTSRKELRWISAMITSGLPDGPVRATWVVDGAALRLDAEHSEGVFAQTFVRDDAGGLKAIMDVMVLDPKHHKTGNATRLVRNLAILFDRLGVACAETHANWGNGGYTWAILGARPKDADVQRRELRKRLDACVREGSIPAWAKRHVRETIDSTHDDDLMYEVAALELETTHDIGKVLLGPHSWDAYWDITDEAFRVHLTETLK
jgi:hypothetical protein